MEARKLKIQNYNTFDNRVKNSKDPYGGFCQFTDTTEILESIPEAISDRKHMKEQPKLKSLTRAPSTPEKLRPETNERNETPLTNTFIR